MPGQTSTPAFGPERYTSLFRLDGRTAVVVGAGGGIGAEVAHALGAFGATVFCADIDAEAASATAHEIDGAHAIGVDVVDPASVSAALASTGVPDILVTTVGTNVRKRLVDYTDSDVRRVIDINLVGVLNLVRVYGASMAERGSGSLVAFSSVRALSVEPGQGVYAATKAGVIQLMRTAAAEFGAAGVRCNVVAPGVVETPLTEQIRANPEWYDAYAAKSALGRWAQPSELVGAVVYLASPASAFVTGSVLFVDGGWTAVDGRYEPPR